MGKNVEEAQSSKKTEEKLCQERLGHAEGIPKREENQESATAPEESPKAVQKTGEV